MSGKFLKVALVATAVAATGGAALGAAGAAGAGSALTTTGMAASMTSAVAPAATGIFGTGIGGLQALQLGGMALSGFGQFQAAQAADANNSFNARLQELNARQAEANAKLSRLSAQEAADRSRDATRRRIGSIRAVQAKSGVVTTEGSPLLVQQEQASEGDYEASKILYQGELDAQGFGNQVTSSRLKAQANRSNRSGTFANVVSSVAPVLTGAGKVLA